jgi:hypothetical protein
MGVDEVASKDISQFIRHNINMMLNASLQVFISR